MFRYFNDVSYAEDFMSGSVRFGSLDQYQRIEDSTRRDENEGQGLVREWRDDRQAICVTQGVAPRTISSPGHVERHSEMGNPVFILCFTRPPLERSKFGAFPVEVVDTDKLISEVHASLDKACPWQRNAALVVWDVHYDKGEIATDSRDPVRLAVAQKRRRFLEERETRLVLISHNVVVRDEEGRAPIPNFLTVKVSRSLDSCMRRHY